MQLGLWYWWCWCLSSPTWPQNGLPRRSWRNRPPNHLTPPRTHARYADLTVCGYFSLLDVRLQSITLDLPLSHSGSWSRVRNFQTTTVSRLLPRVLWVNRRRPICLTVSPWKSRVSVFYTSHSSACSWAMMCFSSNIQKTIVLTLISPPLSLWPDLHGAGSGSCAAGEAAGALPRCEGYRDRTSRAGPPIVPGGSLPDAEGVGGERVTCRTRWNAALALVAGVVGRTEKDAPGMGSWGAGDKVRHSVILQRVPSWTKSLWNQVLFSSETHSRTATKQTNGHGATAKAVLFHSNQCHWALYLSSCISHAEITASNYWERQIKWFWEGESQKMWFCTDKFCLKIKRTINNVYVFIFILKE